MNIYFSSKIVENLAFLDIQEASHAIKVMRMKIGDRIFITNGLGTLYECSIEDANIKNFRASILGKQIQEKQPYYLEMVIAPTKNMDRLEWFIEKSVEMGVQRIIPIICHQSERKIVKHERLQSIVLSAMKQSLKFNATQIEEALPFKEFIKKPFSGNRFICHCQEGEKKGVEVLKNHNNVQIIIGPEGDFSKDEIEQALQQNAISLSLGESRLRTETAGVLATAAMYLYHGKK